MAAFAKNVSDSTAETDPQQWERTKNLLRTVAETAQKQYGGIGSRPMSVSADPYSTLSADRKYASGEFGRRKAAAESSFDIAKTQDERQGEFGNRVRAALYDRQKLAEETPLKQQQMEREAALGMRNTLTEGQQKINEINFSAFKNAADRIDSMNTAYDKGILEMQLLDLNKQGMLEMADIDRYFTLLKADMLNMLKGIEAEGELKREQYLKELETKSDNMSAIISGLFGAAGSIVDGAFNKDKK